MPIILNPEEGNVDYLKAGRDLGTTIFGSATDRANRDVRAAQADNYAAEALKARAEAERLRMAMAAQGHGAEDFATIGYQDGDTPISYRQRTAGALARIAQWNPNTNYEQLMSGLNKGVGGALAYSPVMDDRRAALTGMGVPGSVTDALGSPELSQYQAADFAKTNRTALASEYGARQERAGVDARTAAMKEWQLDQNRRQFPGADVAPDHELHLYADSPLRKETPSGVIGGRKGTGSTSKPMDINPDREWETERSVLAQLGAVANDEDGKAVFDPGILAQIKKSDRIAALKDMTDTLRSTNGDIAQAKAAYLRRLHITPGSSYDAKKGITLANGKPYKRPDGTSWGAEVAPAAAPKQDDGVDSEQQDAGSGAVPPKKTPPAAAPAVAQPGPVSSIFLGDGPSSYLDQPQASPSVIGDVFGGGGSPSAELDAAAAIRKPSAAPAPTVAPDAVPTAAPVVVPTTKSAGPVANVFSGPGANSKAQPAPIIENAAQLPKGADRYNGQILTLKTRDGKHVVVQFNEKTGRWLPINRKGP